MKLEQVFASYKENILPTYTKTPLVFTKGKGSRIWDINNKEYLDFFPGWGVGNLGHCHPKVMQAVRDQVSKLIFIPNNYYHIPQAKLAAEMIRLTYPGKVFFCNSGAEANEGAIKLTRKYGRGRYEIITFENSFHGRTLATLAATGQKKYQFGFEPLPEGFKTVKFNDIEAVRAAVNAKTAGVMLELIQGEGGVNPADKEFVLSLKKLCGERDLLLIVDEVQTGVGRTGKLFCYEHYGITPDIMTLAKSLGGGLPIGMMVVKKEISETLGPGTHASTFGGGPVIARAALAVLEETKKKKFMAHVRQMSEYLFTCLENLKAKYGIIQQVRGMGLMAGVELSIEGKSVVEDCIKQGLLINCTHDKVLRLMPALNITKGQINKAMVILDNVLAKAQGAV